MIKIRKIILFNEIIDPIDEIEAIAIHFFLFRSCNETRAFDTNQGFRFEHQLTGFAFAVHRAEKKEVFISPARSTTARKPIAFSISRNNYDTERINSPTSRLLHARNIAFSF